MLANTQEPSLFLPFQSLWGDQIFPHGPKLAAVARESQVPPWLPHTPGGFQQRWEGSGISRNHMTVLMGGLQGGLET